MLFFGSGNLFLFLLNSRRIILYRVIINDCPIIVGVENPHKCWMCRQPRNVGQTSRQISTTAGSATYRRY
jgi:hypothetical protein